MNKSKPKNNEQQYVDACLKRLQKNRREVLVEDDSDRWKDWFDFHARTDEVIVPSQWVTRLDEANAVHQQLDYLRDKLEADFPQETEKVDREAVYCSSALYKMRQNAFYQRLSEHQMRWHPVVLIGELASSLPKPTTDPQEIERQLYSLNSSDSQSLTMLRRPLTKIDIKVDEIEDLNTAIQERKAQKPGMANRDAIGAPVLPPPPQSLFSFLDGVGVNATPR